MQQCSNKFQCIQRRICIFYNFFLKHWTQPVKGDQLNMVKLICDYISGLWTYSWCWSYFDIFVTLIFIFVTLILIFVTLIDWSQGNVKHAPWLRGVCRVQRRARRCLLHFSFFLFSLFSSLSEFFFALFTWLTKVSPPPPAWTWCAASWPPSTPCWWPASCSTSPASPSTCSAGAQCHLEIQISIKLGQGSQFHLKSKYSQNLVRAPNPTIATTSDTTLKIYGLNSSIIPVSQIQSPFLKLSEFCIILAVSPF